MYLPEGDIRWETRLSGRAYIVLARRAEDGCLELGVTSHDGRDRPLTQLSGHIPSRDRQVVARLLATALEFEAPVAETGKDRYVRYFENWSALTEGFPDSLDPSDEADFGERFDPSRAVDHYPVQGFSPAYDVSSSWASTVETQREKYPNAYKPWTAEDDERLRKRHAEGAGVEDLMTEFGRGRGAVVARLARVVLDSGSAQQQEESQSSGQHGVRSGDEGGFTQ